MKHTQESLEQIANVIESNYLNLSDREWFKVVDILSERINSVKKSNDPVPYKVRVLDFS